MVRDDDLTNAILKHSARYWLASSECMQLREPVVVVSGGTAPTATVVFDSSMETLSEIKKDENLSDSIKYECESYLHSHIKDAIRRVGLLTEIPGNPTPLEKLLSRINPQYMNITEDLQVAISEGNYSDVGALNPLALKALKIGKPDVALAIYTALSESDISIPKPSVKNATKAFLNGVIAVSDSPSVSVGVEHQNALIKLLDHIDVDENLPIKGLSISNYCSGEPALSMVTSHLNTKVVDSVIAQDESPDVVDQSELVSTGRNRSF